LLIYNTYRTNYTEYSGEVQVRSSRRRIIQKRNHSFNNCSDRDKINSNNYTDKERSVGFF